MIIECRQIELGRSGSIPEVEIKWEGKPIPKPIEYHRTASMVAFAEVCGPDDILNNAWHDIVTCALAAAGAAGVATIVAGPSGAYAVFEASFFPCLEIKLKDRAKEVQLALSTQQKPNDDWHQ